MRAGGLWRAFGLAFSLGGAPLAVVGLGGCDVTPEKIEHWKETEKGPGKLRDALKSSRLSPELRGHAFAALVELSMLGDATEDLKDVPDAERRPLVHDAVPRLVKLAQAPAGATTTRVQREAKDALFVVRDWALPADQADIDDALVAWTTADLAGRASAGGQSTEKILLKIGPKAAHALSTIVADDASSEGSRMVAATLLGQIYTTAAPGDTAPREVAGAALVARARHARNVDDALLRQIGLVGGDHAVAYLATIAEDSHQMVSLRQKALGALVARPDAAALPAALRIASDKKAPGEVRESAFNLAEKIGPPAVPGLVKLLDDKDDLVRWRAVEAALGAGKDKAVRPVLEALPEARSYSRDDVRSYIVHDLDMIGPAARAPLTAELASKSAVARLAAVSGLASVGTKADAEAVGALAGDGAKVKGFDASIGAEAKAAADALRAKTK